MRPWRQPQPQQDQECRHRQHAVDGEHPLRRDQRQQQPATGRRNDLAGLIDALVQAVGGHQQRFGRGQLDRRLPGRGEGGVDDAADEDDQQQDLDIGGDHQGEGEHAAAEVGEEQHQLEVGAIDPGG